MVFHKVKVRLEECSEEAERIFNCPCRDLLASLIERAVLDLRHPRAIIRNDARSWIFSRNTEPFSLHWCLQCLDIVHTQKYICNKAHPIMAAVRKDYRAMCYTKGDIFACTGRYTDTT